jgi:periplasmic protein TonB
MFDMIIHPSRVSTAKRLKTMTVSGLVHTGFIGAALLVPLHYLAPQVPIPDGIAAFLVATPPAPPPPPPAPAPIRPQELVNTVQRTLAPIEAPLTIEPEHPVETASATSGVVGGVEGGVSWGVPGGIVGGLPGTVAAPPPPPPAPSEPVRIGGQIKAPALIKRVEPVYPALAEAARMEGMVILEATVDKAGHVEAVRILRSGGVFDEPAIDAVRQWQYSPLTLNDRPTEFVLTVTLQFHLG